jgi:hypothetical protein
LAGGKLGTRRRSARLRRRGACSLASCRFHGQSTGSSSAVGSLARMSGLARSPSSSWRPSASSAVRARAGSVNRSTKRRRAPHSHASASTSCTRQRRVAQSMRLKRGRCDGSAGCGRGCALGWRTALDGFVLASAAAGGLPDAPRAFVASSAARCEVFVETSGGGHCHGGVRGRGGESGTTAPRRDECGAKAP